MDIKIKILETHGIYVKDQEVEMSIAQGQQWINSGYAALVGAGIVAERRGAKPKEEPKEEAKGEPKPKAKKAKPEAKG